MRELAAIGFTLEQATALQKKTRDTDAVIPEYRDRIYNRARLNGKPVSVFTYPDFVADPDIETYSGKFAYGFDLSSGAKAAKFEDPETHTPVDNQLWRAVGCIKEYFGSPPQKSLLEDTSWDAITDSAPAWILQISGGDLGKDGKVTVTFDRAIQHLERDATANALWGATYVVDPSMTSHNVLQGEIKDGVLTIAPHRIYLQSEMPFYADIELDNGHLRIERQADGKLIGYMGGFLDWARYAYMSTARPGNDADAVEKYHALKKMADADPDPATGQNRKISGTFRWEAVPAFLADSQGRIIASPEQAMELAKVAKNTGE
jgi:hypothetical protein